jgi:hypothetical protein
MREEGNAVNHSSTTRDVHGSMEKPYNMVDSKNQALDHSLMSHLVAVEYISSVTRSSN